MMRPKEKYIPYVIEPSLGADRVVLAFLCAAYDEEELEDGSTRTVMHFHPELAPVKIGVLPLSKKLNEGAEKVYAMLSKYYNCEFDDRGNIGKRYRRQDEIGTPFCVTYDFDSEEDGAVTVRDRDTMQQERIKIEDLKAYFEKKFEVVDLKRSGFPRFGKSGSFCAKKVCLGGCETNGTNISVQIPLCQPSF